VPIDRLVRISSSLLLIIELSIWGNVAHAWGPLGHEIAGSLCEGLLDSHSRQQVRLLIGDEPLAKASHWADRMRQNPSRFWQGEARSYHYVTIPQGKRYRDVGPPPQGDALSALAMFRRELRNPHTSRERAQLALRFAVHITQDLHQPFHAGNGLDRGANDIKVRAQGVRGKPTLHWVWDSYILGSANRTVAEWLNYLREVEPSSPPSTDDRNPERWVQESATLRDSLYPPPEFVDEAYLTRWLPVVEERLSAAGRRCAAWVNITLSPGQTQP